jgi:hypothetical protein
LFPELFPYSTIVTFNHLFTVMDFKLMPDEIVEEIFLKLPRQQILDLNFVSKRFNEVVSNSIKLMDSFWIEWRSDNDDDPPPSKRKYRTLQITGVVSLRPNLRNFLKDHGSTLLSSRPPTAVSHPLSSSISSTASLATLRNSVSQHLT